VGHIIKIYRWVAQKATQYDNIPQPLITLAFNNTITKTE
jgi:hypothetical protein